MRPRPLRRAIAAGLLAVAAAAVPALADHTDPTSPLAPIVPLGPEALDSGEGTWEHIASFGGTTGTDLEFFHHDGVLYGSVGQLGQGSPPAGIPGGLIGQRILKLVEADGTVNPEFVADHGSGHCGDISNVAATTSLQHDAQTTPKALYVHESGAKPDAELVIDTVDALGRCHDRLGGGLEFIDVSGVGEEGFEPREVHLLRLNGYSHTVTVDAARPWLVYNNPSDFGTNQTPEGPGIGRAWIDVIDIRTCLGNTGMSLEDKRARCRPKTYRVPFEYEWSSQRLPDDTLRQPSNCHDITARPGRIYCAALNATLVFDVSGLTTAQGPQVPRPDDPAGDVKGQPLPCEVVEAEPAQGVSGTGAMVTDCALGGPASNVEQSIEAWTKAGRPVATGWRFIGNVNHPGRYDQEGGNGGNTNTVVRADEGVAISHEADPTPDGKWMFVTDERGGGVVPPGATCAASIDNPYGNGGIHVFDLNKRDDKGSFAYAETPDGEKAIYISRNVTLSPTFCTVHVIEPVPDENRLMAAWYSQGLKIIDYAIDADGKWTFEEVASYALLPNDIWAAEHFKIEDNADGTRTYYFLATDIARGADVFSWTGPANKSQVQPTTAPTTRPPSPNPRPTQPRPRPRPPLPVTGGDLGLLALATVVLPLALVLRRHRLRRG